MIYVTFLNKRNPMYDCRILSKLGSSATSTTVKVLPFNFSFLIQIKLKFLTFSIQILVALKKLF